MSSSIFYGTFRLCRPAITVLVNRSSNVASAALWKRLATATPNTNRFFSSNDLSDILARELEEENETGSSMPEDLAELKETISEYWTIVDDGESGTVKLFRKEGPEKVAVVFHCQDTLDEELDDSEEESSPEVRFTLTVTKAGKTMVLNCVSVDASAVVESVVTTNEDIELIHDTGKVDEKLYQGPQFDELAEDLQDAFTEYVKEECGITSDVAAFISMFADFKEQQEYVRWLNQVKLIL
mmetsp:Transcript_21793/g.32187  ORF Transcript_21793/g.32187 Transcript_21793/m.32187 type:complete len:240 (-) Transcript_21793:70-789(-)|eukprot:CAMPEP_0194212770 /NCGR_PEP_ID=MMETSP0156-20130528/12820_1 /TAXON_ID=33649 /ORGANISM="Thalassionema nitzschioides, Strain L26-B" /LENGTH=239 /DNA_ID=CAMNT_0038940649 /DNA_START=89 /DNA_END=808 /DNA_ORIENTATION=+